MDRRQLLQGGGIALLALLGVVTGAYLFTAPAAEPSEAGDLFDAPRGTDGGFCFRASSFRSSGEFVVSVDATDPDHRVRYFESRNSITRIDHYRTNDTSVAVHRFYGPEAESRYRDRLARIRSGDDDENRTVVADDSSSTIEVVTTNATFEGTWEFGLLVPFLSALKWEGVNETAYRPVGGWVEQGSELGSNATTYVDSAEGVLRTDGNGSVRRVDVTFRAISNVKYRIEPLLKDGDTVHVSFNRTPCRPESVDVPDPSERLPP